MLPETIQITLKMADVFHRLKIPYMIGGSFASAIYGSARATVDADFIADIQPDQIHDLILALKDEFYIDPDMILDSIVHQSTFNLIHMGSMFKIDVFILKDRPFEINEMHRRILRNIGDEPSQEAYFVTAEDLILAKLDWFKAGGEISERQWKDIQGILRLQKGRLDLDYLKKWSAEMGLADLFSRALTECREEVILRKRR